MISFSSMLCVAKERGARDSKGGEWQREGRVVEWRGEEEGVEGGEREGGERGGWWREGREREWNEVREGE